VRAALAAGAHGFVSKTDCPVIVGRAIEAVARGETFLSRSVQLLLDEAPGVDLTPRETEVLRWVGHGMTNKEIAQKLGLAVRTVESHRERLMTKLDAHNAADLTRAAIKRGLASA
jgi:DNA-binding NarL/FixJ family response regulator